MRVPGVGAVARVSAGNSAGPGEKTGSGPARRLERLPDEVVRAHRAMSMRIRCGIDRYIILRELARGVLVMGNCFRMVGGEW